MIGLVFALVLDVWSVHFVLVVGLLEFQVVDSCAGALVWKKVFDELCSTWCLLYLRLLSLISVAGRWKVSKCKVRVAHYPNSAGWAVISGFGWYHTERTLQKLKERI